MERGRISRRCRQSLSPGGAKYGLHCKAPREENFERAAAPRGSAACNRLSQGQKRSSLFQLNVSGHIAGMTPIQRRDFRLDEKADAAFRKAKKKIQVLTSQYLVVKSP